jgi:hypothetical protein
MEWKWTPTNKEPYEKTARYVKREESPEQLIKPPNFENLAHSYSLNCNESSGWESESFLENQFKIDNKRENVYNKMAEREMIGQIGMNPFLDKDDYVKNVVDRDMFLKPVNTNADREKKKDTEEYQ